MYIVRVRKLMASELDHLDFSFEVEEVALPPFDDSKLSNVTSVSPYKKRYALDHELLENLNVGQSMAAIACEEKQIAGFILVSQAWNNCAQIDAFAVDRIYRRRGVGQALMKEALLWAKESGLSIVRLETQSDNVSACRFYERYGFKLGGFDRHLYDAITPAGRSETALFYYLHFN